MVLWQQGAAASPNIPVERTAKTLARFARRSPLALRLNSESPLTF